MRLRPLKSREAFLLSLIEESASTETTQLVSLENNILNFSKMKAVVSGVITSNYDQDLYYVNFLATAYNDQGVLVGGGEVFGEVLPAHSSIGVVVPFILDEKPARVELSFSGDRSTAEEPPTDLKLEAAKTAIDRNPERTDAGAVVVFKNPDAATAVVKAAYILTVYNSDGMVLDTCHETIYGIFFPGKQFPIGCSLKIPLTADGSGWRWFPWWIRALFCQVV